MIATQLQIMFTTIDCAIIHYALRETGCAASPLLCLLGPVRLRNLQRQIRTAAGLSIHKISHEVTRLWVIKSQRGGEGSTDGGANKKKIYNQDVFPTVMIRRLLPSL